MLKSLQWTALLAAIALLLALAGISYLSSPPSGHPREEQPTTQTETPKQQEKEHSFSGFIRFMFPDAISIFTFWLVIATVLLGITAIVQISLLRRAEQIAAESASAAKSSADAAKKSVEMSANTFVATQRPFINIVGVGAVSWSDPPNVVKGWSIQVRFQNVGNTPGVNVRSFYGFETFEGEVPADYDFDQDYRPETGPIMAIAPKGEHQTPARMAIAIATIDRVQKGEIKLLVFGRLDYGNLLGGDEKYFVKYCYEISVVNDPHVPGGPNVPLPFLFHVFERHNSYR